MRQENEHSTRAASELLERIGRNAAAKVDKDPRGAYRLLRQELLLNMAELDATGAMPLDKLVGALKTINDLIGTDENEENPLDTLIALVEGEDAEKDRIT